MKKIFHKRFGILVAALVAAAFMSGCSSTGQVAVPGTSVQLQSPVTTQQMPLTAQQVVAYATPWLQAAANVANALVANGKAPASDVALAETTANAALASFQAQPTASTLNTLQQAMVPVYSAVNAASSPGK